MDVQICQYCGNPTTYSPIAQMERYGYKVFFCHTCQVEYVNQSDWSRVALYTTVKGKMFRYTMAKNEAYAQLWKIDKPGIPGVRVNEKMKLIVSFNDIQGIVITPQNIQSKIKSWLPFL